MSDELNVRVDALAREVDRLRRRDRGYQAVIAGLLGLVLLRPAIGEAGHSARSLDIASADGAQVMHLQPGGIEVDTNGKPRIKLEVGPDWDDLSTFGPTGTSTWSVASDKSGTSMKIFSKDEKLRVEVAEALIDSGSGVRLYDRTGSPRATFYADQRQGASGVQLTDANRQPRIDLYAQPDGMSVLRANNADATSSAELSVLPRSDMWSRQTGMPPAPQAHEPYVPMLYMVDPAGTTNTLVTPGSQP